MDDQTEYGAQLGAHEGLDEEQWYTLELATMVDHGVQLRGHN